MTASSTWWPWRQQASTSFGSFAVIGVGRFGSAVCAELTQNGAAVLAIDANQRAIDAVSVIDPAIEARVVDCTDEEALREAGALEVDTVVVAIGEPMEASISATLIVKHGDGSKVKQVIARATSDLHLKLLERVGADRVVYPSKMQGHRLGLELVRPNLLERLKLDDRNSIEEIRVPQAFVGRSLQELNLRKTRGITVLAAGPVNELTVNPPASRVLQPGDLLVVMGSAEALNRLPCC
jgi:trk system potassium uptake protein TrkA